MRLYHFLTVGVVILLLSAVAVTFAAPGDLDPTFDTDGLVFHTSANLGGFEAIAYQPDDKLIACGIFKNGLGANWIIIARYLSDGQPDPAFNSVGERVFMPGNANSLVHDATCEGVGLQSDGKIIFGGDAKGSFGTQITFQGTYLGRVNPDGTLDTTFGTNGYVFTGTPRFEPEPSIEYLESITIAPDDSIIVSGDISDDIDSGALWKYTPDGTPDLTFGLDGHFRIPIGYGYNSTIDKVLIESNGKITGAGSIGYGPGNVYHFIVRLNPDGTPDLTLDGMDGDGILPFLPDGLLTARYEVLDFIQDTAGNYVIAGGLHISTGNYIIRLLPDGSIDTGFGLNGLSSFAEFSAKTINIQSDGTIVMGGDVGADLFQLRQMGLSRLLSDGTVDTAFGSNGIITLSPGQGGIENDFAYSLDALIQPDGKIILAGIGYYYDVTFDPFVGILARFDLDAVPTAVDMSANLTESTQNHSLTVFITLILIATTAISIKTVKRSA